MDNRPVSVRAASAAKLSQVAGLARALGLVGAGRVPMQAERCGVRINIKSDDGIVGKITAGHLSKASDRANRTDAST